MRIVFAACFLVLKHRHVNMYSADAIYKNTAADAVIR
jgi:hypothetical protein